MREGRDGRDDGLNAFWGRDCKVLRGRNGGGEGGGGGGGGDGA